MSTPPSVSLAVRVERRLLHLRNTANNSIPLAFISSPPSSSFSPSSASSVSAVHSSNRENDLSSSLPIPRLKRYRKKVGKGHYYHPTQSEVESIVELFTYSGMKCTDILSRLNNPRLKLKTIEKIVRDFRKTGKVPQGYDEKRKNGTLRGAMERKFTEVDRELILRHRQKHPGCTYREIKEFMQKEGRFVPSNASISRMLKSIEAHETKADPSFLIRNTEENTRKRMEYIEASKGLSPTELIFVDEMGFNHRQVRGGTKRKRSALEVHDLTSEAPTWTLIPSSSGGNITIILGLSPEHGVVHREVTEGASTASVYAKFVSSSYKHSCLENSPQKYIVHHSARFRDPSEVLGESPVHPRFHPLPPYSPQFNLCQYAFSFIKWFVKVQVDHLTGRGKKVDYRSIINEAIDLITQKHVSKWYEYVRKAYTNSARKRGEIEPSWFRREREIKSVAVIFRDEAGDERQTEKKVYVEEEALYGEQEPIDWVEVEGQETGKYSILVVSEHEEKGES
jgi:hypothetical protein